MIRDIFGALVIVGIFFAGYQQGKQKVYEEFKDEMKHNNNV